MVAPTRIKAAKRMKRQDLFLKTQRIYNAENALRTAKLPGLPP